MTPSILLVVPAVASSIGLPILAVPQPPDYVTAVQNFASQFATETAAVLRSVDSAVVDIVLIAYVTCLLVGALLYFTHLGRKLGKHLIVGGVLLAVAGEYVIPAVTALK